MIEFLRKLFSSDFMPHGYCYLWTPGIIWLHAISDGTIALSYYLIPLGLVYFVRKRRDLPFHWMFLLFGLFIFGCGTTHLMEVWTLWHGTYWLAGAIKAITAAASVVTAALFVPLIPRALALPSPAQMRDANLRLEREIGERTRVQESLQRAHDELDIRVQQRTAEIARAIQQLLAEITERMRAEEALRKQANLLELAHDAIIVRDLDDRITYWNSGAEETYGWLRQEALGKLAQVLLHPTYPSDLEAVKSELIREGRWDGELTQTCRDGRRIVVASRWALQRDDSGKPAAMLQINTDITERKQAEEKLRRSEQFLTQGQSLSHTGSWGWNVTSGRLVFSEEAFCILGFAPAQAAPSFQEVMERIHPEDRPFIDRLLAAAIREKTDYEFDARLVLPDGSTKYVHSVGRAVTKEESDLEFVGTLMDVTERKAAEQTLQTAQAQLAHMARVSTMGELAASIAHEVNQPLAAVVTNGSACLRWLAGAEPNLDEARAAVTRIVKEGTRAGEIVGRIRSLMKKSPPHVSTLDMNGVIHEVLTLTSHEIGRHGVQLRTELEAGLPAITGDPVQLQQVMLNLIMNAIEATSARGEGERELLLTSESQRKDEILIAVRDSGVGIDPRNLDLMFKPFFTTKTSGMGMGLSISRATIEAHGGRLWAAPNEGTGAIFQFSLPVSVIA
jgi:PAS domain S-box-containing protein